MTVLWKRFSGVFVLAAASLLYTSAAKADSLLFTLNSPSQTARVGQTLTFIGTITAPTSNTGAVSLDGDSFSVASPLTLDDSAFFTFTPSALNPGQFYSGALFSVILPGTAPPVTYSGFFTVLGSSNGSSVNATAPFAIAATPEPSSLLLAGSGLASIVAAWRRKRLFS